MVDFCCSGVFRLRKYISNNVKTMLLSENLNSFDFDLQYMNYEVTIDLSEYVGLKKSLVAKVINVDGQIEMRKYIKSNVIELDLSDLSAGVYLVNLNAGNESYNLGSIVR